MDKIMQISKAGKEAISKINDQKKKMLANFRKLRKILNLKRRN